MRRYLKPAVIIAALLAGTRAAVEAWRSAAREKSRAGTTEAGEHQRSPVDAPANPVTRAKLYEEAKRLNIQGRSRMTKAELEKAVAGGNKR
jgi:hypothetical protein